MVANMNLTESESGVNVPLNDVNLENGLRDPEQRTTSHNEEPGRNEQNVDRCRLKHHRKYILILAVTFIVSVAVTFIILYLVEHVQRKQLQAEMKQLQAEIKQLQAEIKQTPKILPTASCPQGWSTNAEFCYIFSNADGTWDMSLSNCSSFDASLFVMSTHEEMTFINKNKAPTEYWIGLRRKSISEPWKHPDGTDYNAEFKINGNGLCATLNDGVFSSTDCDSLRHWICRKHLHAV